jgi:hypothetical protein
MKSPKAKAFTTAVYAIDCQHAESGNQEVSGLVHLGGQLAIHQDRVLGYVVDHRGSGLWIAQFRTLSAAKRFVIAVADMHWNFGDPSEIKDEGFKKEVEEIFKTVKSSERKRSGVPGSGTLNR